MEAVSGGRGARGGGGSSGSKLCCSATRVKHARSQSARDLTGLLVLAQTATPVTMFRPPFGRRPQRLLALGRVRNDFDARRTRGDVRLLVVRLFFLLGFVRKGRRRPSALRRCRSEILVQVVFRSALFVSGASVLAAGADSGSAHVARHRKERA